MLRAQAQRGFERIETQHVAQVHRDDPPVGERDDPGRRYYSHHGTSRTGGPSRQTQDPGDVQRAQQCHPAALAVTRPRQHHPDGGETGARAQQHQQPVGPPQPAGERGGGVGRSGRHEGGKDSRWLPWQAWPDGWDAHARNEVSRLDAGASGRHGAATRKIHGLAPSRLRPDLSDMYSRSSEPVRFERDCAAVLVPQGEKVNLPAGSVGYITQALGGSWTVFVEGNLFRIAGVDADAIGKEPPEPLELPADADDDAVEQMVWRQLRTCFDPEIPINVVDLGLVYEANVKPHPDKPGQRLVEIRMTLTA